MLFSDLWIHIILIEMHFSVVDSYHLDRDSKRYINDNNKNENRLKYILHIITYENNPVLHLIIIKFGMSEEKTPDLIANLREAAK